MQYQSIILNFILNSNKKNESPKLVLGDIS